MLYLPIAFIRSFLRDRLWLGLAWLVSILLLPVIGLAQISDTPTQAVFSDLFLPDTHFVAEHANSRIGINTFAFISRGRAFIKTDRHFTKVNLFNNLVYNQAVVQNPFISKDYIAQALYDYKLFNNLSTGFRINHIDYAANQTRIITTNWNTTYWLAKENSSFEAIVAPGIMADRRAGRENTGLGLEIALRGTTLFPFDSLLSINSFLQAGYYNISPRSNQFLRGQIASFRNFSDAAQIQAGASYFYRKIEDFALNNIQSIGSDTIGGFLNIGYNINNNISYQSSNSGYIPSRSFSYRPLEGQANRQNIFYSQADINTNQELRARYERWQLVSRFSYSLRDRAYEIENNLNLSPTALEQARATEIQKDIREASTTWSHNLTIKLNDKHTLSASGTAQLLRVDTRSMLNTQDRDEVLYNAEISEEWLINERLRLKTRLAGTYRHFVFIDEAQSIENFKERILRFDPTIYYKAGPFSWVAENSLFVTYNVRDFDSEQLKNRSNRIFLSNHQFSWRLPKRSMISIDLQRRENRLGLLNWQRFTESPLDTIILYDISPKFTQEYRSKNNNRFSYWAGYRYFRQERRNLAGLSRESGGTVQIALNNIILQHGPRLGLEYITHYRLRLYLDAWLQLNRVFFRYKEGEQPFIGQSFSEADLRAQQRNFFPYFTFSCRYNIADWRNFP